MDKRFKEIIKEAILEALAEFTGAGVATMGLADPVPGGTDVGSGTGTDTGSDKGDDNSGNNSGNNSGQGGGSENSSGGNLNDGRPIPDVGVGTWSLRN
jgi:hypothetical protein